MAHPAFVCRAYYRQNRGSFPSAFPVGKLDALAIFEEDDGEARKALIAWQRTPVPGRVLTHSGKGVGWEARGSPCPLQSHRGTAGSCCGNPVGFGERLMHALWREAGLGDAWPVPPSVPRRAGRVLAPMRPTIRCRWGLWVPWAPCPPAPGWVLSPERGKSPGLRPLYLQPGPRWEAACTH